MPRETIDGWHFETSDTDDEVQVTGPQGHECFRVSRDGELRVCRPVSGKRWEIIPLTILTKALEWHKDQLRRARDKDWNLCPYDSHADDCDCRGMGGDR